MNVHCVGFVLATREEIADGSAFRAAARFCEWDATVVIRCEQTGQDLQVQCPAGIPRSVTNYSDPADRFESEWRRKYGIL